jgi:hypothetical protein
MKVRDEQECPQAVIRFLEHSFYFTVYLQIVKNEKEMIIIIFY